MSLRIRPFQNADLNRILEISDIAFAPIRESFCEILGSSLFTHIYPDWIDYHHRGIESACHGEGGCMAWVAEQDGTVIGFVTIQLNDTSKIGEIGFNAVHPDYQGFGIGTQLYIFALNHMMSAGMRVAYVGTGGDDSHAPARRAYEKVGFRPLPLVSYYKEL